MKMPHFIWMKIRLQHEEGRLRPERCTHSLSLRGPQDKHTQLPVVWGPWSHPWLGCAVMVLIPILGAVL